MRSHVQHALKTNLQYGMGHLEDIPPEQWHEIPAGLAHNPAWLVGHIVSSLEYVAGMLGAPTPHLPSWGELFGMDSSSVADPQRYPPKDELLQAFDEAHETYASLLADASDEQLERPSPEGMRDFFPTLGDALVFMGTVHEAVHLGQLSEWRLARGLPMHV